MSEADIEATLRKADLEKWIQPLRALPASNPPVDSNVFILEIHAGEWDLYWEPDGRAAEQLDFDASYEVDGGHSRGKPRRRFQRVPLVRGRRNAKAHMGRHDLWSHRGIPEEVFQTAFYMSGEFEKQV